MTDDEFESQDEWQHLADECTMLLDEAQIRNELREEGILDTLDLRRYTMFMDYRKLLPVYSIALTSSRHAEVSICAMRMSEVPFKWFNPIAVANAPYFNEIKDNMLLDIIDARLYGVVPLRDDPGDLYIAPANPQSHIREFLKPQVVQIEGFESFILRHDFNCEDQTAVEEVLTPDFFSLVDELGDPYVEIRKGMLIVGYKKPIDDSQPAKIANFLLAFAEPSDSHPD